jgi:hypothetical protein
MGVLSEFIATLAVKFLREWLARYSLQKATRLELLLEIEKLGVKAAEWKARAAVSPSGGAELRVREGAGKIKLPGSNPDS